MTNPNDTPPESPTAKRLMDTRHSGNGEDSYPKPRLSRTLPPLPPLPLEPTIKDVAWRDGTLASFLHAQWPLLFDELKLVASGLEELKRASRRSYAWPLVTGISVTLALWAWAPRIVALLHR